MAFSPLPDSQEDLPIASGRAPLRAERAPANARWLGLLVLTALAAMAGEALTLRGVSQVAEEQGLLSRELHLQNQLSQISSQLSEAHLCQAAYVGTGRRDYVVQFRRLQSRLLYRVQSLRMPQKSTRVQQRLAQFPAQTRRYLAHLEHAVSLRETRQPSDALRALEASVAEGEALKKTVGLLRSDSQRESLRREKILDLESQRQYAEAMVRAAVFTLLLLGAYVLLRAERRFHSQRLRSLQKENAYLRDLSEEDGLTRLNNRRAFDMRLEVEWQRAARHTFPLSVVVLDVDNFKSYNDAFGHPAGDAILRQMAHALVQTARLSDIVARYGGEEFALILPHTDATDALIVGERLRAFLLRSEWPNRAITASIGVATRMETMENSGALVDAADMALYFAKENGRDRVVHWDKIKDRDALLPTASGSGRGA